MTQPPPQATAPAPELLRETLVLSEQVGLLTKSVLAHQGLPPGDRHRVMLLIMARRMYAFFLAARQLAATGLPDPAAAVLRTFLEQAYMFGALERDPDAIRLMGEQGNEEMRKALSGLLRLSPDARPAELTEPVLNAALAQFEARGGFNAFDWADKIGLRDSYLTLYRRLCVHAHGSLVPLADYVRWHEDGVGFSLGDSDAANDMPGYLVAACSLMLDIASTLAGWDSTPAMRTQHEQLGVRLQALSDRLAEHQALQMPGAPVHLGGSEP